MKLATAKMLLKYLVFKVSWRLRQRLLQSEFTSQKLQKMSKRFYESISKVGEWETNDYRMYVLKIIQKLPKNLSLIDVGCGDGWFLSQIAVSSKVGVDFSKKLLLKTKERNGKLMLVLASVEWLPFRKGVFDFTISLDVLEHVLKPNSVLQEIKRVTKKLVLFTTDYDGILNPSPRSQIIDNTPPLKILRKHGCQLTFFRMGQPTSMIKGLLFGTGVMGISVNS